MIGAERLRTGPRPDSPSDGGPPPRWPRRLPFAVASVGVLAWAALVNLFRLGTPTLMGDERIYALAGWRYVHGQVAAPLKAVPGKWIVNSDNFEHPPLAKWMFGLAQLIVGHVSVTTDRAVVAAVTLLSGAVLAVWTARLAGRWTGLLAGALLVLLPESVCGTWGVRFGRYGFLDPVMELFVVVYLALMWEWLTRRGRSAWLLAGAAGVAVGCAAACKENGGLAAVLPVALGIAVAARERRVLMERIGQSALAVGACGATFLVTYLPFSHPLQRIVYMLQFQGLHTGTGGLISLAGRVTLRPPWWANGWFAEQGLGVAAAAFLVTAALVALVLRRDRVCVYLLAALAGPAVFHSLVAGVALPYYWTAWIPPLVVLAALGVAETAARAGRLVATGPAARPAFTGVVVLSLLAPAWAAAAVTRRTLAVSPTGTPVLGSVLDRRGLHGAVLTTGVYDVGYYFPHRAILTAPPSSLQGVDAVAIGRPECQVVPDDPTTMAIVASNLAAGRLRQIYRDRGITVYEASGPLQSPSASQVAHLDLSGPPAAWC